MFSEEQIHRCRRREGMRRRDKVILHSGVSLGPGGWKCSAGAVGEGSLWEAPGGLRSRAALSAMGCRLEGGQEAKGADFLSDPSVHGWRSPPGDWGPNLCCSQTLDVNPAN